MRIKSLHLNRFGHFNDHTIDFNNSGIKQADFHLIYGANEAGKSTTLSAIIDLLFGMPLKTKFNFLHKNETLEIGATISQTNGDLSFKRFKNNITDAAGSNINATAIDTHGLNRAEYIHRFSFDEDMLKEGGESILQNQGELGATLFSATSGLSDFNQMLNDTLLLNENEYHPNTRKRDELSELKEQLKAVIDEQKELDISSSAWTKLQREATEKLEVYQAFSAETKNRKLELSKLQAIHAALSIAKKLESIQHKSKNLSSASILPISWINTARNLIVERSETEKEISLSTQRTKQLNDEVGTLISNDLLLKNSATIEHLNLSKQLYLQRNDDLKKLNLEIESHSILIDDLLSRLHLPTDTKTENLQLSKSEVADIENQLSNIEKLEQHLSTAKNEIELLDQQLSSNKGTIVANSIDITPLNLYLEELADTGLQAQVAQAQQHIKTLETALQDALDTLHPWKGTIAELQGAREPQQLNDWNEKLTSLITNIQQHESSIRQTEFDKKQLQSELSNIKETDEHISPTLTLRHRSEAWTDHVRQLDEKLSYEDLQRTARVFSQSMHEHDTAMASKIINQQAEDKAKSLTSQLSLLDQKLKHENNVLSDHVSNFNTLNKQLTKVKQSIGYADDEQFDLLLTWYKNRDHVLHIAKELDTAIAYEKSLTKMLIKNNLRLKEHIHAISEKQSNKPNTAFLHKADYNETLNYAKSLIESTRKDNKFFEDNKRLTEKLQSDLIHRKNIHAKFQNELVSARVQLSDLLSNTFLSVIPINKLSTKLPEIKELEQAIQLRNTKKQTLSELSILQSDFRSDVAQLSKLAEELELKNSSDPTGFIGALAQALSEQKEIMTSKNRILKELNTLQSQTTIAKGKLDQLNQELGSKKLLTANDDTQSLQLKLDDAKLLAELKLEESKLKDELSLILHESYSDDTLKTLVGTDATVVQEQIEELQRQIEADESHLRELHYAYRKLQDPIDTFQSDNKVAQLAQQRANLLLEIEELAKKALKIRLGHLAIQQGLDKFRETHKSGMLENANNVFKTITCGNFLNLISQPNGKGGDQLIAINKEGMSKQATEMSTGTRTQLYLALRIAAYQEYCEHRTPLPFVADDIMETFDDDRSAATLKVLHDMAKQGQVIYFTHHRHMFELAKQSIGPDVHIHELPARPTLINVPA